MDAAARLQKRIPEVRNVTAMNADLVLTRIRVDSQQRGRVEQKASIGLLGIGKHGSCWPCVENISTKGRDWNWLRKGPYKVRMVHPPKRKNEILQIAAPWWGQHLIHPTGTWQGLRGCIAVGDVFDSARLRLENSEAAHKELMYELGPFERNKEFTLFVENDPEDKNPNAAQKKWFAGKVRKEIRRLKKKR